MPLPAPDSPDLLALRLSYQAREIYRLLFENQGSPLTMHEIRGRLAHIGTQEQLDRRRRELNRYFVIEHATEGRETSYMLVARKERDAGLDVGISEKDRAVVLRHGRCAQCGRTPLEDNVKLQVDHKIPKSWGGTDDLENLQPLCEECNRGKKDLFESYRDYEEHMRAAIKYDEPQKRIGEFLKAVFPDEVPSDVLELVANTKDYQQDWQKRLRELRVLGWVITTRRAKEDRRVRVYYRLVRAPRWPKGSIRAAIRRLENQRGY
jgi:5-methylcytosine-specific restriction endonuclease McrA